MGRTMHIRKVLSLVTTAAFALSLASTAGAGDAKKGKIAYTSRCAFCHGPGGKGDGPAAAQLRPPPTNFTTPDFWKNATSDTIKTVIQNGKQGTPMLSFKASLNTEQIDDLIAYLQTFKPQQ